MIQREENLKGTLKICFKRGIALLSAFIFLLCIGKFQEESDHPAAQFLRVSHTMDGDMTTSESVKFDWPRYAYLTNLKLICLSKEHLSVILNLSE